LFEEVVRYFEGEEMSKAKYEWELKKECEENNSVEFIRGENGDIAIISYADKPEGMKVVNCKMSEIEFYELLEDLVRLVRP